MARAGLALQGRTDNDVAGWLAQEFGDRGLDAAKVDRHYPDELSGHAIQDGAAYDGEQWQTAERELSIWYANAAPVLSAVAVRHRDIVPGPSPVRCWPHHFDMATLIQLDDGDPESARSVGVGFSPGDQSYPEPYYYVTPWPYPEVPGLPAIGELGHWHRDGFVAAIASAERILVSDQQEKAVVEFLAQSVTACMDVLAFDPS